MVSLEELFHHGRLLEIRGPMMPLKGSGGAFQGSTPACR